MKFSEINWLHTILLTTTPLAGIYGLLTTQLTWETLLLSIIYYYLTAIGITAGYHRYWAHRSYQASLPLRVFLALAGSGAFEGSIRWWCRDHRAHHRYTDTDKDPYDAKKGLLWSHIGWMLFKKDPKNKGHVDISDLLADPIVRAQHKYYFFLSMFMSLIFPTLIAGLFWNDFRGGYFYAGVIRLVIVHHATFCVNSLAHWLGEISYDDLQTPRDHFITALVTMGEGYHNFHHEFPNDYRNAVRWYQFDPTKWTIKFWEAIGLAYELKRFPENEVRKGRVTMLEKQVDEEKSKLDWGKDASELPEYTLEEFKEKTSNEGKIWTIISGYVHDISTFMKDHPGGLALIKSAKGRDATADFNGAVHMHRHAARNLLATMRVGVIKGSCEANVAA